MQIPQDGSRAFDELVFPCACSAEVESVRGEVMVSAGRRNKMEAFGSTELKWKRQFGMMLVDLLQRTEGVRDQDCLMTEGTRIL